ncbi:MAG: hypothetical protein IT457_12620 [Planctomycetes bacterium]|nr:hypothetical protein [Planctomycetota bacterium]
MLARLALGLLVSTQAILAQVEVEAPADGGVGYRRFEPPDFIGLFEDPLLTRLELAEREGEYAGTLRLDQSWEVHARLETDGQGQPSLKGEGRHVDGRTEPFSARWHEARLIVTFGDKTRTLHRILDMPASLTILGEREPDPERRWTVAVYLGGDNNLERNALVDLEELRAAMPERGVELVVLLDRHRDADDGPDDWTETRVLRLRHGADPVEIATPGELDTNTPEVLAGFLTGVFARFPAPRHAVFIWNHGSGWSGVVSDDERPTGSADRVMSVPDVRRALRTAITRSLMWPSIDLIAFDACLMSHLEVAVEMSDVARVMVASQAIVDGTGFPYRQVLPRFASSDDPREIARGIVADYAAATEAEFGNGATLAAIDLRKVAPVARAVDGLARACLPAMDRQWKNLARSLFFAEAYQARPHRMASGGARSVDLLDAMNRFARSAPELQLGKRLATLEAAVADAVIAAHHGEIRRLSRGLSIFGPIGVRQFDDAYAKTWFGAGNAWTALLVVTLLHAEAMEDEVRLDELTCVGPDGKPTTSLAILGGGGIRAAITGDAIVQVQHRDLVRDGERWWLAGKRFVADHLWSRRVEEAASDEVDLVMPQFADGRNEIGSEVLGVHFEVTNDEIRVPCTLDRSMPSMQSPWRTLAQYRAGPDAPWLDVVVEFHHAVWQIVRILPLSPEGDVIVERAIEEPPPIAELRFALEFVADDGTLSVEHGVALPIKDGLALTLVPDALGPHRIELIAQTLDGRSGHGAVDFELVSDPVLEAWRASWDTMDPGELVGTWRQQLVLGPERWSDTKVWFELGDGPTVGRGLFDVLGKLGEQGEDGVTHQRWFFVAGELPILRMLTEIEDHRWYTQYGPAAFGEIEGKRFIVMKPLDLPGVLWRWEKR